MLPLSLPRAARNFCAGWAASWPRQASRCWSTGIKAGAEAELLADAAILRAALPAGQVKLVLDDRADLVEQIGFDGVHVDAGDLTPAEAQNAARAGAHRGNLRRRRGGICPGNSGSAGGLFFHRPGLCDAHQADQHRR